MKTPSIPIKAAFGIGLFALITAVTVRAESRTFSMPRYLVNPGGVLQVPLMLDNAAGLAAIQVQLNFDPKVVELQSANAGPLGQAFEMSHGEGDGFVQLTFFRAQAMAQGSGRLAVLRFRANPGAVTDLFSELTIANIVLSDSTGVIDLRQKDQLSLQSGHVTVSPKPSIDNTGSGLPDWWEEQHNLDPFTNNRLLDPEGDGLNNLLEYAFGGNPRAADAHLFGAQARHHEVNGERFLGLGFRRRLGDASLFFRVQESQDLSEWTELDLDQRIIGVPQNMGDGTEFVNVLGTIRITGPDAKRKGFLRVGVEKSD